MTEKENADNPSSTPATTDAEPTKPAELSKEIAATAAAETPAKPADPSPTPVPAEATSLKSETAVDKTSEPNEVAESSEIDATAKTSSPDDVNAEAKKSESPDDKRK